MKNSILWLPLFIVIATLLLAASPAAAQESKTATVTTAVLKGTVVQVEGNDLLVRMSTGELRNFNVPETRKFVIDGKELSVHQLQPGTTLTATVTTTTVPGTIQTKSVQRARVWFVSPPTVILTMPSGENKQFIVKDTVQDHGKRQTRDRARPAEGRCNLSGEGRRGTPRGDRDEHHRRGACAASDRAVNSTRTDTDGCAVNQYRTGA